MNRQFHFIGIGGIGMSSIAQLLMKQGNSVTGSDVKESEILLRLRSQGARIHIGHSSSNIEDPDAVIYSSAISTGNIELQTAVERNIPIIRRAQMLAQLMDGKIGITVAGAHGKTTTTSLISFILSEAGLKPTVSIGGLISNFDENAWIGEGSYFVSEVDESDGTFLLFSPFYSVITNIDYEHVDYYKNWENIKDAYRKFMQKTNPKGCIFGCGDDQILKALLKNCGRQCITYGLSNDCNIYATDISINSFSSSFVYNYQKKEVGRATINIPGKHNIVNSLAAIGLGIELGIDFDKICKIISNYKGVRRRFQVKGDINNILVVDDYGHHPTEIKAVLEAAKNVGRNRVVVAFQPHRYTRTKYLWDLFVESLALSDYLVITDIYAASEKPIPGVDSADLCKKLKDSGHAEAHFSSRDKLVDHILQIVRPGDMVITLGAGDITKVSDELVKRLSENPKR